MAKFNKETALSYLAGAVFSFAWWLWIDCNVYTVYSNERNTKIYFPHYLPGIVGTIALIMINVVRWSDLNSNNMFGSGVSNKARAWMFFSFIIAFGCIAAAIWIAIVHWFQGNPTTSVYPGVAIIIKNLLIFVSAMLYRFAKPQDDLGL